MSRAITDVDQSQSQPTSFCPNVLDFEASGFGPSSYPIEVGFVLGDGQRYCRLIQPCEAWRHWDARAEALHRISRETLTQVGLPIEQICQELNHHLAGLRVFTDAWVYDNAWLNRLYARAACQPAFELSAIEHIQSECQHLIWDQTRQTLIDAEPMSDRHRASADAELIQRVYTETQTLCQQQVGQSSD